MEPVLSRRSGMNMDLLTAWSELVGTDYCDFTRPEKINWPNRAHEDDPFKPGVLVVACDGARALYFQHELKQVCERVNVFFGFAAISKIKIVQKPVHNRENQIGSGLKPKRVTKLDGDKENRLKSILSHIDDPELKKKLEKLGQGVLGASGD